jgi:hypothetical protein
MTWQVIEKFPEYECSRAGQIRCIRTKSPVKLYANPKGYLFCILYKKFKNWHGTDSSGFRTHFHSYTTRPAPLIATAWLGPCPKGLQINHIDGNKSNCSVQNMEYKTQSYNIREAYRMGLNHSTTGQRRHDLDERFHQEIFRLSKQGLSQVRIGKILGCSNSTCSKVLNYKTRPRLHNRVHPELDNEKTIRWLREDQQLGYGTMSWILGIRPSNVKRKLRKLGIK